MDTGAVAQMPRLVPVQRMDEGKLCFFDLPAEIRVQVYDHYFDDPKGFRVTSPNKCKSQWKGTYQNVKVNDTSDTVKNDNWGRKVKERRYEAMVVHVLDEQCKGMRAKRHEIVINQAGYLHANLPMLSLASKALFTETWPYNYDKDACVVFHICYLDLSILTERHTVVGLLVKLCNLEITEERTVLVLHGMSEKNLTSYRDTSPISIRNLKQWLLKHWIHGKPLFDFQLDYIGFEYGNYWGIPFRLHASHFSACLNIIKYSRLLYQIDYGTWKESVQKFTADIEQSEFDQREERRNPRRRPAHCAPDTRVIWRPDKATDDALDEPVTCVDLRDRQIVERLIRSVVYCAQFFDFDIKSGASYLSEGLIHCRHKVEAHRDYLASKLRSISTLEGIQGVDGKRDADDNV